MRRALRTGLFIGIVIGMSACAMTPGDGASRGPYGSVEAGRSR
jgi:hypothetical protein